MTISTTFEKLPIGAYFDYYSHLLRKVSDKHGQSIANVFPASDVDENWRPGAVVFFATTNTVVEITPKLNELDNEFKTTFGSMSVGAHFLGVKAGHIFRKTDAAHAMCIDKPGPGAAQVSAPDTLFVRLPLMKAARNYILETSKEAAAANAWKAHEENVTLGEALLRDLKARHKCEDEQLAQALKPREVKPAESPVMTSDLKMEEDLRVLIESHAYALGLARNAESLMKAKGFGSAMHRLELIVGKEKRG